MNFKIYELLSPSGKFALALKVCAHVCFVLKGEELAFHSPLSQCLPVHRATTGYEDEVLDLLS